MKKSEKLDIYSQQIKKLEQKQREVEQENEKEKDKELIPIALEKIETESKYIGFISPQEIEMKKELLKNGEINEKDISRFTPKELRDI